jgi:hypothetical protein
MLGLRRDALSSWARRYKDVISIGLLRKNNWQELLLNSPCDNEPPLQTNNSMTTIRTWFIVSGCLLTALAGWHWLGLDFTQTAATSSSRTASATVSVAETAAQPQASRERPEISRPPCPPKMERRQANEGVTMTSALTNSNSPANSQDLDQNREWARNFPSGAVAWLNNAPDGEQRLAVAEIVCPQLAQTNAAAAVTLAENCLGDGTNDSAQYLLGTMAQLWVGQDMQAASAWALAKPAGGQRDRLLQHIALAESKTDPNQAAQLVAQQISPGQFQNEAAVSVVYQWAQQDAKAALTWAESFPAGDLRDRAIKEVKNVSAISAGNLPMN